jgi:hypothetical protein
MAAGWDGGEDGGVSPHFSCLGYGGWLDGNHPFIICGGYSGLAMNS